MDKKECFRVNNSAILVEDRKWMYWRAIGLLWRAKMGRGGEREGFSSLSGD
jgi:hypothetical protein